jgi:hypothetical protein
MEILYYISTIVWLVPAIRNYKKSLFYFFFLTAIHDPFFLLARVSFDYTLDASFTVFIIYLMTVFLIKQPGKNKRTLIHIGFAAIITILLWLFFNQNVKLFLIVAQVILMLLLIIKKFAEYSIENKAYNIFYILVIFYFLTLILKFLTIFIGTEYATEYFIITTIFQILFGLFFSVFREDDPRLFVKLE